MFDLPVAFGILVVFSLFGFITICSLLWHGHCTNQLYYAVLKERDDLKQELLLLESRYKILSIGKPPVRRG